MDVIRCFALFTIAANHFYSYSGYLTQPMDGPVMYGMTLLHQVFLVTIPVFLMLSGYLMKNKKPTRSYYAKLVDTLGIYLLASLCCMIYHTLSYTLQGRTPMSLPFQIIGIFSYTTVPYGWYINMYIGLFLLIPFLNVLYNNLESQRSKQYLILSLLCLSTVPNFLNIFRFDSLAWWIQPSSVGSYHHLFPDWWYDSYPLTYYFLGAYLREYPLEMKPSRHILLILVCSFLFGSFQFYRSYPGPYVTGVWQDWGSPFLGLQAVLYFNLFATLDYSRLSPKLCRIFAAVSKLTLGAYLVSSIFDEAFYGILTGAIPEVTARFPWCAVTVPAILICSLALSAVINWIYEVLRGIFFRLTRTKKPA